MDEFRKDLVTALVDGETNDPVLKQDILSKIESDESLAIDYKAQLLLKNLVKEKVLWKAIPNRVKARVLRKINSNIKVEGSGIFSNLFNKPAFSFATLFVVIFAVILILLNRSSIVEQKDFSSEQRGSNNMLVQAKNNFSNIVSGKLKPQLASDNSIEINNFFKANGVNYSTSVPEISNWKLLGAVVSENKGIKFAHYMCVNKKGKLAYLFQVDKSFLIKREIISLSQDLINFLEEGNCYSSFSDSSITLFTKVGNNIFAIVSNENQKVVEQDFCKL